MDGTSEVRCTYNDGGRNGGWGCSIHILGVDTADNDKFGGTDGGGHTPALSRGVHNQKTL